MRRLTRSLAMCFTTAFEAFARPSLPVQASAPVIRKLPDNRLHRAGLGPAERRGIIRSEWAFPHELGGLPVLGAEHKELRSFAGEKIFIHLMRSSCQAQFQAPGTSWNGGSWQTSVRHGG